MNKVRQSLYLLMFSMACAALSGCGQKGPLVLPDEKPANNATEQSQNTP